MYGFDTPIDSKLEGLMDQATAAEYALDDAIRANGYGSPLNQPFRDKVNRTQGWVDSYRERLETEARV